MGWWWVITWRIFVINWSSVAPLQYFFLALHMNGVHIVVTICIFLRWWCGCMWKKNKKNFTLEQRFIIIPSVCREFSSIGVRFVFTGCVYECAFLCKNNFQLNSTSFPIFFRLLISLFLPAEFYYKFYAFYFGQPTRYSPLNFFFFFLCVNVVCVWCCIKQ